MSEFDEYLTQAPIAGALKSVLASLAQTGVAISSLVRLGALSGVLGSAGSGNIQGEEQKKLDVLANQLLLEAMQANPAVAAVASEEEDHSVPCHDAGQYLVLFDPLDGSSNIDVNISVGTIFSILPRPQGVVSDASFLQSGRAQVAAGYVLYGPQTLLVLSFGADLAIFTLNENGRFMATPLPLRVPEATCEFAINMSNQRHWQAPMQRYVAELLAGETGPRGKNYNMRWVASMVAEVHRILVRGGVFAYPKDARDDRAGKLRLMYEANPLAFLIEAAGGSSSNGHTATLDIAPQSLHERVAVMLGAREEIALINEHHRPS